MPKKKTTPRPIIATDLVRTSDDGRKGVSMHALVACGLADRYDHVLVSAVRLRLQMAPRTADGVEDSIILSIEDVKKLLGLRRQVKARTIAAQMLAHIDEIGALMTPQETAQVELMPAPESSAPYATQIDWRAFVVEHDGVRGVSLRALVEAGLYEQMSHAVRALESSGINFCPVQDESTGGRPSTDRIIPDLADAQMFCVQARTDVGKQIARLIIEHHSEFQRLLNGDAEAHAQLAAVQPPAALSTDPILAMLSALAATREAQMAQEAALARVSDQQQVQAQALEITHQRLAMVEARYTVPAGWISMIVAAQRCGAYSSTGKPHNRALLALARQMDLDVREKMAEMPTGHQAEPASYIAPDDVPTLKAALKALSAGAGGARVVPVRTATVTYQIHLN